MTKFKLSIFFSLICITIAGYYFVPFFIGKPPVKEIVPQHSPDVNHAFPELQAIREKVKNNPEDQEALAELAEVLKGKVIATRDRNLIFELIDTLTKLLQLNPTNHYALLELANITFESKVFSKAAEYYQQYLATNPDDLEVRSRYASSLIFIKNEIEAIKELDLILAKQQDNFSALAYKAIALSQLSKIEEARAVGKLALKHAPDEEGRVRFENFLASLDAPQNALVAYLTSNQITAQKFVSLEAEDSILNIYFRDFPMDQMPEFARDKFINSLKESIGTTEEYKLIQNVALLDFETKKEMFNFSLSK